ncbi:MAG: hypothetical protein ACLFPH_10810, partial [Bacteroidales bacterium]
DEKELKLLKRDEILELLFYIPREPFQIGITYNNKKHIAYKAPVNSSGYDNYDIITDEGIVRFERENAWSIWSLAEEMYTVLPGKSDTKQQPTYFTKDEIRGIKQPGYKKVKEFGIQKYYELTKELEIYKGKALFKLIIHLLNKATL